MKINKKLLLALCTAASLLAGIPVQGIIEYLSLCTHTKEPYKHPALLLIGEHHMRPNQQVQEYISIKNSSSNLMKLLTSNKVSVAVESSEDQADKAFKLLSEQKDTMLPILQLLQAVAHQSGALKAHIVPVEWRDDKNINNIVVFFTYVLPDLLLELQNTVVSYFKSKQVTTKALNVIQKLQTMDPYQFHSHLINNKIVEKESLVQVNINYYYNLFKEQLQKKLASYDFSYTELIESFDALDKKITCVNTTDRRKALSKATAIKVNNALKEILQAFPQTDANVIETILTTTLAKDKSYESLTFDTLWESAWYKPLIADLADFGFIADIKTFKRPVIVVYAGSSHTDKVKQYFLQDSEGYKELCRADVAIQDPQNPNSIIPIDDSRLYDPIFNMVDAFIAKHTQEVQKNFNKTPAKRKLFEDQKEDHLQQKLKKLKK